MLKSQKGNFFVKEQVAESGSDMKSDSGYKSLLASERDDMSMVSQLVQGDLDSLLAHDDRALDSSDSVDDQIQQMEAEEEQKLQETAEMHSSALSQ